MPVNTDMLSRYKGLLEGHPFETRDFSCHCWHHHGGDFFTTGPLFILGLCPWELGGGGWDDARPGRVGGGTPSGFQGQLGQSLRLLQPVSRASGLLFCPAEPSPLHSVADTSLSQRCSQAGGSSEKSKESDVGWRGPGAGSEGGWKGAVPVEAEAFGSVGPSREPET